MTITERDRDEALTFPDGFLWGAATASYQIEGAVHEGGRGESIWDRFSHTPGKVLNGDTGDVACDHYHRFKRDVAIMSDLGVKSYRFSLAWPRLQPDGKGRLNPAGVEFYERLIDELTRAGIRPWVTLYHWDLPQALEDAGGWPLRDTAYRFRDYAAAVHDRLGDAADTWTTLNEPWCSAFLGYASGHHAPGRTDDAASIRAVHHLLLGHGLAVDAMRSARPDQQYGITLNLSPVDPAGESPGDHDAARRIDGLANRLFLDPVLAGRYPDDILDDLGPLVAPDLIADGDSALIATPLDVLGINYYARTVVRKILPGENRPAAIAGERDPAWVGCGDVGKVDTGLPKTAMGWEVDPTGLHDLLVRLAKDYDTPPLYVTENGAAFADTVVADGVHDTERLAFLDRHFRAARRAIDDGVDLRGYFVWSLLDNFEWAWGYDRRFGVVHVDFETQERTVKDSGHWYAEVTRANALPPLTE